MLLALEVTICLFSQTPAWTVHAKLSLEWTVNDIVLVSLSTQSVASETAASSPPETQAQRQNSDLLQSYWTRICVLNGVPLFGMGNIWEACWSIGPYLLGIWIHSAYTKSWASFVAQLVKNLPTMQETCVQYLVGKIPWRRKRQPTPVLLPGKFHGQRSGTGCSPWNHRVGHRAKRSRFITMSLGCLWSGREDSWLWIRRHELNYYLCHIPPVLSQLCYSISLTFRFPVCKTGIMTLQG